MNNQQSNTIAKILIDIKAVHIRPNDFFTWTSGIKSPIYCDNRQIISYPKYRSIIIQAFTDYIKSNHSDCELIAGTATAGIPWASWISEKLDLPMIYIRSSNKGYGLQNSLEGAFKTGQKTLIIEDLISTGKSSVEAALEARKAKLNVQEVLSIFTYGFLKASSHFQNNNLNFHSLSNLSTMLRYSLEEKLLSESQVAIVKKWKQSIENE